MLGNSQSGTIESGEEGEREEGGSEQKYRDEKTVRVDTLKQGNRFLFDCCIMRKLDKEENMLEEKARPSRQLSMHPPGIGCMFMDRVRVRLERIFGRETETNSLT